MDCCAEVVVVVVVDGDNEDGANVTIVMEGPLEPPLSVVFHTEMPHSAATHRTIKASMGVAAVTVQVTRRTTTIAISIAIVVGGSVEFDDLVF